MHCVKNFQIWSLSGPHFPTFRLNTERYSYLPIFSPNAELYGPEKLRIRIFFQGDKYLSWWEIPTKTLYDLREVFS